MLAVEALARGARRGVQLPAQRPAQALVLAQRLVPLAGAGVQAHQGPVRRLVARAPRPPPAAAPPPPSGPLRRLVQRGQVDEQPDGERPQGLAPAGEPLLVRVLRQQVAAVQRQRRLWSARPAARRAAAGAASKAPASAHTPPGARSVSTSSARWRYGRPWRG